MFPALAMGMTNSASAAVLTPLPANATSFQQTFQLFLDYDSDSCPPVAAIDSSGRLNGGLDDSGPVTGQCRADHLGKANTYSRAKCDNGWCAISYALYFEKDRNCAGCIVTSHRHDWEGVVVWVPQGQSTPGFVSVSRHGQYETRSWGNVPAKTGVRPRVVYHEDGGSTHIMRFAGADERPEAWGDGGWDMPALVSWEKLGQPLRDKLNGPRGATPTSRCRTAGGRPSCPGPGLPASRSSPGLRVDESSWVVSAVTTTETTHDLTQQAPWSRQTPHSPVVPGSSFCVHHWARHFRPLCDTSLPPV